MNDVNIDGDEVNAVLCFGNKLQMARNKVYATLRKKYQNAEISISSLSVEILQSTVKDDSLVAATIQFDSTEIRSVSTLIAVHDSSFSTGKFLANEAKELPGAALSYPLSMIIPGLDKYLVRTIFSVNEEEKSMVFAGDVPEGSNVRPMQANFDRLRIAASNPAVLSAKDSLPDDSFALLVSCVGRKLFLGPRLEDEIDAARQTLGTNVPVLGFYPYGEISPFNEGGDCQLHNQTMTITKFYELQ